MFLKKRSAIVHIYSFVELRELSASRTLERSHTAVLSCTEAAEITVNESNRPDKAELGFK